MGALEAPLKQDYDINQVSNLSVNTLFQSLGTLPGITLAARNYVNNIIAGSVNFPYISQNDRFSYLGQPTLRGFCDVLATFSDSYIFETHDSKLTMIAPSQISEQLIAGNLSTVGLTDPAFYHLRGVRVEPRVNDVRNNVLGLSNTVRAGVFDAAGSFTADTRSTFATGTVSVSLWERP